MTTKKNIPAFPVSDIFSGMTLRDYFAAKAMQSLLIGSFTEIGQEGIEMNRLPNQNVEDLMADTAYKYSDAMLKARNGNS
jgi:hypothetical protein